MEPVVLAPEAGLCVQPCDSPQISQRKKIPSPHCNIMMMHFDTKHTIIVHQGDPKHNTETPQTHDNNIFFLFTRSSSKVRGSGCSFLSQGWFVADREAPNVTGVFKDDSKLNENYANWIYTLARIVQSVCFTKGVIWCMCSPERVVLYSLEQKKKKKFPTTHRLPQCLLICFLGLFET